MILAVDIGNSSISIGIFKDGKLIFSGKLKSSLDKSEDEYAALICEILKMNGIRISEVTGAIMLSVVPGLIHPITAALKKIAVEPLTVGAGLKTGLDIRTQIPGRLGADLVASAVGALVKKKSPLIIVDLGAATTVSVINERNEMCGCIIAPGVKLSADALSEKCALIPDVPLCKPSKLLGTNTAESVNSGCICGSALMIDGFINKIRGEYGFGDNLSIIATGGLASLVVPFCENKIEIAPELTLYGLYRIYNLNKKQKIK